MLCFVNFYKYALAEVCVLHQIVPKFTIKIHINLAGVCDLFITTAVFHTR